MEQLYPLFIDGFLLTSVPRKNVNFFVNKTRHKRQFLSRFSFGLVYICFQNGNKYTKEKNILIAQRENLLALMTSKTYTSKLRLNKERSITLVLTLEAKLEVFLII